MYENALIENYVEVEEEEEQSVSDPLLVERAGEAVVYCIRTKPLTWKEAYSLLINSNPNNITSIKPYRPAGGRVYIYDATAHNFTKKAWRADGYSWDSTYGGANLYPSKINKSETVIKKLLWPLNKADRRFVRYEWQLTENAKTMLESKTSHVLVHYIGDETVFKPPLAKKTKSTFRSSFPSRRVESRSDITDCLLNGAKRETDDEALLDSSPGSYPLVGITHPRDRKRKAPRMLSDAAHLHDYEPSKGNNVAEEHTYYAETSHDDTMKALLKDCAMSEEKNWHQIECEFRMKLAAKKFELKKQLIKKNMEVAEAKRKYYETLTNHSIVNQF